MIEFQIDGDRDVYQPGEAIAGTVSWQFDQPATGVEVRLFWYTRGKGTTDVHVAQAQHFDLPGTTGRRAFRFVLPEEPYSFSGKLISLGAGGGRATRRPVGPPRAGGRPGRPRGVAGGGRAGEAMRARDNPFAADRVLRVRYRPQGWTWDGLLDRLGRMNYRGAIVGPEGRGKTTLLEDLGERLVRQGHGVKFLRLSRERPALDRGALADLRTSLTDRDVILFDGAEQLGPLAWWRFTRAACRARGLVITSHRPGLLPTLADCETDVDLLRSIVTELLGREAHAPGERAEALFTRHRGNLRDALREMYDQYAN